jgi:hypothetical protein
MTDLGEVGTYPKGPFQNVPTSSERKSASVSTRRSIASTRALARARTQVLERYGNDLRMAQMAADIATLYEKQIAESRNGSPAPSDTGEHILAEDSRVDPSIIVDANVNTATTMLMQPRAPHESEEEYDRRRKAVRRVTQQFQVKVKPRASQLRPRTADMAVRCHRAIEPN